MPKRVKTDRFENVVVWTGQRGVFWKRPGVIFDWFSVNNRTKPGTQNAWNIFIFERKRFSEDWRKQCKNACLGEKKQYIFLAFLEGSENGVLWKRVRIIHLCQCLKSFLSRTVYIIYIIFDPIVSLYSSIFQLFISSICSTIKFSITKNFFSEWTD